MLTLTLVQHPATVDDRNSRFLTSGSRETFFSITDQSWDALRGEPVGENAPKYVREGSRIREPIEKRHEKAQQASFRDFEAKELMQAISRASYRFCPLVGATRLSSHIFVE